MSRTRFLECRNLSSALRIINSGILKGEGCQQGIPNGYPVALPWARKAAKLSTMES